MQRFTLSPASGLAFRDAWTAPDGPGGPFQINLAKAREIHRESIREERAERWAANDVAFRRAQEDADPEAWRRAVADANALRDAPQHPAIDAAADDTALAALTLAVLLGELE